MITIQWMHITIGLNIKNLKKIMENKMQEQIEGALYQQQEFYDEIMKCTKNELASKLLQIEYKLDILNEHGLGDSDSEAEKFFLKRDYNIIKQQYDEQE